MIRKLCWRPRSRCEFAWCSYRAKVLSVSGTLFRDVRSRALGRNRPQVNLLPAAGDGEGIIASPASGENAAAVTDAFSFVANCRTSKPRDSGSGERQMHAAFRSRRSTAKTRLARTPAHQTASRRRAGLGVDVVFLFNPSTISACVLIEEHPLAVAGDAELMDVALAIDRSAVGRAPSLGSQTQALSRAGGNQRACSVQVLRVTRVLVQLVGGDAVSRLEFVLNEKSSVVHRQMELPSRRTRYTCRPG